MEMGGEEQEDEQDEGIMDDGMEFEEGEEEHEEDHLSEPSVIKRKRSRIEQNLHKGENPDEEYVFSNIGESI